MARGQIPVKDKTPKNVYCSDCRWFVRETEGVSFKLGTNPRQYFMGDCSQGLHPDTPIKQFANKPRECKTYRAK